MVRCAREFLFETFGSGDGIPFRLQEIKKRTLISKFLDDWLAKHVPQKELDKYQQWENSRCCFCLAQTDDVPEETPTKAYKRSQMAGHLFEEHARSNQQRWIFIPAQKNDEIHEDKTESENEASVGVEMASGVMSLTEGLRAIKMGWKDPTRRRR